LSRFLSRNFWLPDFLREIPLPVLVPESYRFWTILLSLAPEGAFVLGEGGFSVVLNT
jgi:hypothetical protein